MHLVLAARAWRRSKRPSRSRATNIANAGTPGYTRQVITLASNPDVQTSSGQYAGSGVTVTSIQRQVSAALNEGLRGAT